MSGPVLVALSGVPGTGKSTVADAVAALTGAVRLSVDDVEEALLGAGLAPGWETGVAAYEAVRAAATQNLRAGLGVVVDAVNDSAPARETWRRAAADAGAWLFCVLLTPPAPTSHQARLAGRSRGLVLVGEPSWEQVVSRMHGYEPWPDVDLELDSGEPVAALAERVVAAVG